MNDVASPIDLRNYKDAVEWQDTANVKRPWRKDFFEYYASLIKRHAFDFSEAMHQLAQQKLTSSQQARTNYLIGNFKEPDWQSTIKQKYDFIIIHQALHELRHKKYAADFHITVKKLLKPKGYYLVCDHLCAPHAMQNDQLYMNKQEHIGALKEASFENIKMPLEIEGLCLFEMSLD